MKEQMDVISRRTPRGISQSRARTIKRNEVFVNDPRGSGAALNKEDRASIGRSLGELRRDHSGMRKATLGSLRKSAVPPVYNEDA